MNPAKLAIRRYFIELSGAMMLFFISMIAMVRLSHLYPALRPQLALLPVAPVLLAALAIWRGVMRMDEYHRRNILNAIAIGGFAVGVTATVYPFLRLAGLVPVVPYFMAWPVMAATWAMFAWHYQWKDAVSDVGVRRAGLRVLVHAGAIVAMVLAYWLLAGAMGWRHGPGMLFFVAGLGAMVTSGAAIFLRRCW